MEYTEENKKALAEKLNKLRGRVNGIAEKWLDEEIPKKLQELNNLLIKVKQVVTLERSINLATSL